MILLSSYAASTSHSAASVFALWADPSGWPEWDPEVAEVVFQGPAGEGSRGRMRPASGPAVRFRVTAFERDRRFADVTSLPGARVSFDHRVVPEAEGCRVSVDVGLSGPMTWLWRRILGPDLSHAAESSVTGLLARLDRA